jgi:hypothetical protein
MTPKGCYVCARVASRELASETDVGVMYLRGLLNGLHLSRPEAALDKLLHGGILCDKHQQRAEAIAAAMIALNASERSGS